MQESIYVLDLKDEPDSIAEYEKWHKNIWPEVLNHLESIGLTSCEIFRAGNRLVMITHGSASAATDGSGLKLPPEVQLWEDKMDDFQLRLPFAKPGEKWVLASSIFRWRA